MKMTETISSNTNQITNYFTPTSNNDIADPSNNDIVDLTLPPPDPAIDLTVPSRPDPGPPQGKSSESKAVRRTNQKKYHRYKHIPTPRVVINNTTAYVTARQTLRGTNASIR